MSRKFEFTEKFDVPPSVAHAAMTDPDLWSKRVNDSGGRADIDFTPMPDGGFTVTVVENVGAQVLPGVVRKVVRGDMKITRTDTWGPLVDDRATGSLKGGSSGLPSKVEATFELRPISAGSELVMTGFAEVKIPFVGGTIEKLITELIAKLVRSEATESRKWLEQKN